MDIYAKQKACACLEARTGSLMFRPHESNSEKGCLSLLACYTGKSGRLRVSLESQVTVT